ncbi:LiaF transmembrane domain-containing protein [Thermohalobacter berrensis]|uniref:LiaF transmembrane domain-containing protein n=1 Tax=Thermohalobacter berrensis TaxID=99594 RepID=A0A419SVA7_9FIRM|nr:DUF5668 domain-containing protein [Thermohalobacter berrensis]RKD29149.1 hypothetical protein BET03_06280 [Thermohalobacter berrensis]
MKNRNLILGLFLVLFGIFLILRNFGIINWSIWYTLFDLWPFIFIVLGINLIFNKNKNVKIITWILFFALIIGYGFYTQFKLETSSNSKLVLEERKDIKHGNLILDLNGAKIDIKETNDNLIYADVPNPIVKNDVKFRNNTVDIKFNQKSHKKYNNEIYSFNLNNDIDWDIRADLIAIDGNLDFSNLKIRETDLEVEAGNIEINYGNLMESSKVNIESRAANIKIIIPEDIGVKLAFDGVLNHTNLKNLNWDYSDSYYYSPNYNDAKSKLEAEIDMEVGNLTIITK